MAPPANRRLLLFVTCQQSIVASPEALDEAIARRYAPLLDALEANGAPRVALHVHGPLLDRLARAHEGVLLRLKAFVEAGRVELVGGLFYGGPPALLPESDVRGQLAMMGEFWESFVGAQPRGIYLPELAWAHEMPRLLEDTGVDYVLASAAQMVPKTFLGRVERGGLPLLTFGLTHLATDDDDAVARLHALLAAAPPSAPVGLHLSAEELTAHGADVAARMQALQQALAAHGSPSLPREFLAVPPAVVPVHVAHAYAPWGPPRQVAANVADWADFPGRFAEAQLAYRCTLRASGRLARAIATMEDEGLDERWSDALATAQRLIFAAQSAEHFGFGRRAGVLDPAVRDAAIARLIDAERLLDRLTHDEGPFCEVDESDVDGDLQPDVWVHTRAATAWVQPARGGTVRVLEHRDWRRNVLDAGTRRLGAPGAAAGSQAVPSLAAHDTALDVGERQGLRCALLPADVTPSQLLTNAAPDLLAQAAAGNHEGGEGWQVVADATGASSAGTAPAPAPYSLHVRARPNLGTHGRWQLDNELELPADAFGLRWRGRWAREDGGQGASQNAYLWGLEIPLRLGTASLQLRRGGTLLQGEVHEVASGDELVVWGSDAALGLRVRCATPGGTLPLKLYFAPLQGALVDAGETRTAPLGAAMWLCAPADAAGELEVTISAASAPGTPG